MFLNFECGVMVGPLVVSLSNHERSSRSSFDELRTNGLALLFHGPTAGLHKYRASCIIQEGDSIAMGQNDKLSLLSRGERKNVPNIVCLTCGGEIYLDENTYANFRGPIRCAQCRGQQHVSIQRGELVATQLGGDFYDAISDILEYQVPQERLADLAEAAHDLLQNAFKSSVVMSRRCIQGLLLDNNIPDQRLSLMLDAARGTVITDQLYQQAMAGKKFGDAGAHPSDQELRIVTQLDATLCVAIVKEIYKYVYPRVN